MRKLLKKLTAALLVVIMAVTLLPVTATAAPGDYHPDIEILFYPVWTNDYFDYSDQVSQKGHKVIYRVTDGPQDAALTYTPSNGTLKYSKSRFATYFKASGMDVNAYFPKGDRVLGVGDYFAAVVVCKNISKLFGIQAAIKYSSNIKPAGIKITSVGSGRNLVQKASLTTSSAGTAFFGYYDAISGSTYYGLDTEMNGIDRHGNMFLGCAGDTPYSDVSKIKKNTANITNPSTGTLGYNFANTAILGTFIFKITGSGPIKFSVADPNNKTYGGYGGGFYVANFKETAISNFTTYAKQGNCRGSQKMTFFKDWAGKATVKVSVKAPSLKKVKAGKKSAKLTWGKVSGITRYEVQYSTNSKFKNAKTVKVSASKTGVTIKKLKKKKKYYFRIRAVKGNVKSSWSAKKSVKVK